MKWNGTAFDVFIALWIHLCFLSFAAETLKFGSFWKHCIKKSSNLNSEEIILLNK